MTAATLLAGVLTAIMILFLVVHSFQALLTLWAVPELWSHWRVAEDAYFLSLVGTNALPPISVVVALHDAERDAVPFVHTLLDLQYPRYEVVLVNDGSADRTFALLQEAFDLYPVPPAVMVNIPTERVLGYYRSRTHARLLVLDKEHGGPADAMNAGMNAARYPHALATGRNIVFERDALLRLTRPFLLDRDVVAVGSALRAANGARVENGRIVPGAVRGWVLGSELVEYLRSFFMQRLGWNRVASNLLFPGNTTLFKREHIFALGGFRRDIGAPGFDLAIRLERYLTEQGINARTPVIAEQVAWTTLPDTLDGVARVRRRWQRGLVAALRATRGMLGNPEFGMFGLVALPYFTVSAYVLPTAELAGYVLLLIALATGAVTPGFAAAYLAAVLGYGILLSVWAIILYALTFERSESRGSIPRLLAFAVIEALGYRQLMAWYRATALFPARTPTSSHGQQPTESAA
jgi:cellulose synthase/poly-beta-1,6-N-acetylglucosamine synthase-like glycosyltransferase